MEYFNQVPKTVAGLTVLGEEMDSGITQLGESLEIKQLTAAQMEEATDAMVAADNLFNVSRSQQQAAYVNFHVADAALTQWLGKVTGVLGASFGKRWSRRWVQAGFITPSIKLPVTISDRLALALRVINFLSANPGYEAPNQGVTAANGTTLRNNATSTQLLATAADADVSNKGAARDSAVATLTSLMRLLIGVLAELLNPDDTRWLAFGLQMPAKLTTPAAPVGLAIAPSPTQDPSASNTILMLVTCAATPYATRYRFRMRMLDLLGSKSQLVASSTEPMAQIAIPANATVEMIVQAVNGNRQGVASDPVVYQPAANRTITSAAPAEGTAKVFAAETPLPVSNGSNGHANGNRLPALS